MGDMVYRYYPLPLYNLCLDAAISDCTSLCSSCRRDFRLLPPTALIDLYEGLFDQRRLCFLTVEFNELEVLNRLLQSNRKRGFLIKCYQTLLNHTSSITTTLINKFNQYIKMGKKSDKILIDMGLKLGSFLNDGAWFDYSIMLLNITANIILNKEELSAEQLKQLLECYKLKLYAETYYCQFVEAKKTFNSIQEVIEKFRELNSVPNLSVVYSNFSMFYFMCSQYIEAYKWAKESVRLLSNDLPRRDVIEVLRQASKSSVVRREIRQAELLIKQALNLTETICVDERITSSNVMMDYGYYLLHCDAVEESVHIYNKALKKREYLFDSSNIYLGLGHEDFAYALYVNEYSSGNFEEARAHAEQSLSILESVLPENHLMLASGKRVKALILEEMALDERMNKQYKKELLATAEQLHLGALKLCLENFGEKNVQTAKHFGNLGRLYQSMRRYDESEKMHLKAIAIKEELLGAEDYEVGLSIGHLASLYNYHMKEYKKAEALYLRSVNINLKLFGESFSGFEYDYRGLIKVYHKLSDAERMLEYREKMRRWMVLRENVPNLKRKHEFLRPEEIARKFFAVAKQNDDDKDVECNKQIADISEKQEEIIDYNL